MKKLMLITAMSVSLLAIGGCKGKKAETPVTTEKAVERVVESTQVTPDVVKGYTKADYMKACQQAMTETQCECYVDFYKSLGVEVTDLGDAAKVQAAVTNMKPEKAMEMQKCMK